jgi:uncharacterized protein
MMQERIQQLHHYLAQFRGSQLIVAYSGGIDSSLVAKVSHDAFPHNSLAVTAQSPALPAHELAQAISQAQYIGIPHRLVITEELADVNYASNPVNRCYFCKSELHSKLQAIAQTFPEAVVLDGVNADDLQDYRPGIRASREFGVRSPLAELGITKLEVRQIARALGLYWWDKPAQPCLSSRFPYGELITKEKLERVGKAEAYIRAQGWQGDLRVRSRGDRASIEVPSHRIPEFLQSIDFPTLTAVFRSYGFAETALDPAGFCSGKLNQGLDLPH